MRAAVAQGLGAVQLAEVRTLATILCIASMQCSIRYQWAVPVQVTQCWTGSLLKHPRCIGSHCALCAEEQAARSASTASEGALFSQPVSL